MGTLILIVEDDNDISRMLTELLTGKGYDTAQAFSGTEALLRMEQQPPGAVILDLMLPGMSGEEVLSRIKDKYPGTGVIVSSAKDDVRTRVELLRAGADDYVIKPFDTEEILARLEAVLRRSLSTGDLRGSGSGILEYKNIRIQTENREVQAGGREVALTKREYLILELLMSHPGKVFTKANIYESVWNEEFLGEENAVNVHISNIRQKLSKICPEETYIQTVWGIGFKMK